MGIVDEIPGHGTRGGYRVGEGGMSGEEDATGVGEALWAGLEKYDLDVRRPSVWTFG